MTTNREFINVKRIAGPYKCSMLITPNHSLDEYLDTSFGYKNDMWSLGLRKRTKERIEWYFNVHQLSRLKGEIFLECNGITYKLADILDRIEEPLSSIFNIND